VQGKLANGEFVAVKRLNHHSTDQMKQIKSEEDLKNIEHENIVRLVGFCHETRQVPVPDAKNPSKYTLASRRDREFALLRVVKQKSGGLDVERYDEVNNLFFFAIFIFFLCLTFVSLCR